MRVKIDDRKQFSSPEGGQGQLVFDSHYSNDKDQTNRQQ